jgi:cobalt-zinc-cadmium efflux system outer membrane protein
MSLKIKGVGFLVWTLWSAGLWGGELAAARPQTIDSLVAEALARNAEMRHYEAEIAAAKGQRTQAGLWKNPEFTGEYGSRRVRDSSGALAGEGLTRSLALTQTFEFPGKASLRQAVANQDIVMAELGLQQFRIALAGQVRNLAYQHLAAAANSAAAEEISERSTALIRLLRERQVAGVSPLLELRVIEGNLMELQKSAIQFVQESEESALELKMLLGRPISLPLRLADELKPPAHELVSADLVLTALQRNLPLKIRTAELEKAIRQVSSAQWEVAPNFSIGPFFSQDRAGEQEQNFGGSVSVTLPLWDWNQGNIATAKARRAQADAALLEARRKVEAEVLRRIRCYQLAQKQLGQMPEDLVEQSRQTSDLADRQYRTGSIGVQLFLEVQRGFITAQQTRNEAVLRAWKNWLDLEMLTGGAPVPTVEEKK